MVIIIVMLKVNIAEAKAKLSAYRQARDQIQNRMLARFGPPDA